MTKDKGQMTTHLDPSKKHDFIWLFDCTNGNPNGDPDADNTPRTDLQTGHGLVTDACLKRKIRNFVTLASDQRIFVSEGSILNQAIDEAVSAKGLTVDSKKKRLTNPKDVAAARDWMCHNFYDIRMFGAVLSTGKNAGQVRGAVQLTFGESLDPVLPMNLSITRCAATDTNEQGKENKTMGRKNIIPYGLYKAHGFYCPQFAKQTGVTEADLELFWQGLVKCFEFDRSSARGMMATRGVWVFSHESALGNYPTHKLFELLRIENRTPEKPPRAYSDYDVRIVGDIPENVALQKLD
jgi:CRISPR-associated protein Csd2